MERQVTEVGAPVGGPEAVMEVPPKAAAEVVEEEPQAHLAVVGAAAAVKALLAPLVDFQGEEAAEAERVSQEAQGLRV